MAKKISVPIKKLKKPKMKLVNFWIEQGLYDVFENFCEKELDQKAVSEVIRTLIKEVCIQNGYWKQ